MAKDDLTVTNSGGTLYIESGVDTPQSDVGESGDTILPKSTTSVPTIEAAAGGIAPKTTIEFDTRGAYRELLDTQSGEQGKSVTWEPPKNTITTEPKQQESLPQVAILSGDEEKNLPKSIADKVTSGGKQSNDTVTFIGEEELTVITEQIVGEVRDEDRYPSTRLPPGVVLRGPSPPPCEEPPYDYNHPQSCAADASFVVPDWTGESSPFLNGQNCHYYVPLQTTYECPGADELFSRVLEYVPEGVEDLMGHLGKQYEDTDESILYGFVEESVILPYEGQISSSAFETDLSPSSGLKVLYKWPFGLIRALNLQDLPSSIDGAPTDQRSVTLKTDGLFSKIDRFGQQLDVYARKQVTAWSTQKIKFLIAGTAQEINLTGESGQIDKLKMSINNLLGFNEFKISENGSTTVSTQFEIGASVSVADEITFFYDDEYNIVDAYAKERGARERKLNLTILQDGFGIKNKTMFAYLSNIEDIIYDVTRTTPIALSDFVAKYHYPDTERIDGVDAQLPSFFEEGCVGGDLLNIGNSILEELASLDDIFADKFAKYVCMTPSQIERREEQVQKSLENGEFEKLVKSEFSKAIPMDDPFIERIIYGIENISESADVVRAAWDRLFDKMTVCGLFNLISRTIELIAKNDVCGITPEKALMTAITSALKKIDVQEIRRLFDGLPNEIRPLIQEKYFDSIVDFVGEIGSTSGLIFPWDYEERIRNQTEQEELGLLLYSADMFLPDQEQEYNGRLATAYLQGYRHAQFTAANEEEEVAYWSGYVQLSRDQASGPDIRSVDVEVGLSDAQQIELVNEVSVTLNKQSGASFGKLVGNLATDTLEYAVEALINALMGTLQEFYSFTEILSLFEDVPVVGAIIKVLPNVTECAINANIKKDGQEITFKEFQDNLFKGLELDICNLPPGKKPLTWPDFEVVTSRINVDTMWSAFQDALIEVLTQVLIKILIRVLTGIIRKAIEVILGFACAATQGNVDEYLQAALPPALRQAIQGNLRGLVEGALCPGGDTAAPVSPDQQLARLVSSLSPGISEGDALSLLGPTSSCNFVSRIEQRLTAIEIMDLMQGRAQSNTVSAVLAIVNQDCPDLSIIMFDDSSVVNFFQNLGAVFPEGYFDQLRDSLEDQIGPIDQVITECDTDVDSALDDLRDALDCEGEATPEQIDAYIDAFQQRLESTIEDLSSLLATGLDGALEGSIQGAIQDLVPDDDPANILIAEQVVSLLFDPLYAFYARDLMIPLGGSGRPKEAGFINMVLSNKFAVGQAGQMANFGVAYSFFVGPMLGFTAILPPPFDTLASADGLARLARNLRLTFFGPETEEEFVPTLPGFERNPYGYGPLKKPSYIAPSLQDALQNISDFTTVDGEQLTMRLPSQVTLDSLLPSSEAYPGTSLFDMKYNFETGRFSFSSYISPTYDEVDASEEVSFISSTNSRVQQELGDFFEELSGIGSAYTGDFSITPTNIGAALLVRNILDNRDEGASLLNSPEEVYFENLSSIVRKVRSSVIDSYAQSVALNQDAFDYGEYNLEVLTDSDVVGTDPANPQPSAELLEEGYSFVYLSDGQIFIQPPAKGGWLQIKDALLPQTNEAFCCPQQKELFDINSIKDRTLKGYEIAKDDPRLSLNPKTVNQPPYARILSRMNLASCEGNILATIRTYTIEYFLQGYAAFNKFSPNVPNVHSDLISDYVMQRMRRGMLYQGPQPGAPVWPPGLIPTSDILDPSAAGIAPGPLSAQKLHGYWFEFLEQCVQAYSRRIKAGQVVVTGEVNAAMTRLQAVVDGYVQPNKEEIANDRAETIATMAATGVLAPLIPVVLAGFTIKNYRRKKKIEAIRDSEDDAMIILKQLVSEELTRIGDTIDDIFVAPPGGRVENIYLDFLRNAFSARSLGDSTPIFNPNRSIWDIPLHDPSSGATGRTLPYFSWRGPSLVPDDPLPTELVEHFEENDQFILQSYVKFSRTARGIEVLPGLVDNQLYPIEFVQRQLYLDLASYETRTDYWNAELSEYFTFINYGLRLVFVPSANTVDESPEIFENMSEDINSNSQALFQAAPLQLATNIGKYTIPIAASGVLENPYDLSVKTGDFYSIDLSNENIDNSENFEWIEIATRMAELNEFRAMFEYAAPFNTILSLLGIYTMEGFADCIGGPGSDWKTQGGLIRPFKIWNKDMFPILKRNLKKQFNKIYNSNDFTYIQPEMNREARLEAERRRISTSMFPAFDNLTPPVASRITSFNPMCYEDDTGTDIYEVDPEAGQPPDLSDGDPNELVCCEIVGAETSYGRLVETSVRTRQQCLDLGGTIINANEHSNCTDLIVVTDPEAPPTGGDDIDLDIPRDPETETPSGGNGGGGGSGTGGRSGGGPQI
jgi:hypothetical protein